jgi:hypothetical protein
VAVSYIALSFTSEDAQARAFKGARVKSGSHITLADKVLLGVLFFSILIVAGLI